MSAPGKAQARRARRRAIRPGRHTTGNNATTSREAADDDGRHPASRQPDDASEARRDRRCIARTDADAADLITSDVDPVDRQFITGERTAEGFYRTRAGIDQAIARGLAYAPYADLVWCETSEPNLEQAQKFADAIHEKFPGKMLAYNCSPSFNWKKKLDKKTIEKFQREIAKMGYKFQFVTLAGFHALNHSMFELARGYKTRGMAAYSELQEREFASEVNGYTATRHQREVGTGYFDEVAQVVSGGTSSTTALKGSTEEEQFQTHK